MQSVEVAGDSGERAPPPPLPGDQLQPRLVLLEGGAGSPEQIVDGGAGGPLVICDLGQRPVALQVQPEHLALMVGQQGRVALEELDLALSRRKSVKAWHLTDSSGAER